MTKKRTSRMAVCLLALVLMVTSMCCLGTAAVSAAGTYGTTIYLQTDDTTDPYIHYWVEGNASQSSSWPGVKMTKATGETNVYCYELPCDIGDLTGVIFNNGGGGNKLTNDLTNIKGNLYTLKGSSGSWSMYDTSALKLSVETDVEAPQYKGTDIVLKAVVAGGQGTVTYTFSVNSKTIYTGTNSTCTWTPAQAGTYTIKVDAKDAAGNTNSKQISYEIKDDSLAIEPILKGISTGYSGQVPVNTSIPVNVKAAGGNIGTNLLFYKVAVTDPNGNPVNTVYYKQSNILNFTPTKTGNYKVDVTVQNCKNTTAQKSYIVTVGNGGTETPTEAPTQAPTEAPTVAPTQAPTEGQYTKGDVTGDERVSLADVVFVLRAAVGYDGFELTVGTSRFEAADMDNNGVINMQDAVLLARMII